MLWILNHLIGHKQLSLEYPAPAQGCLALVPGPQRLMGRHGANKDAMCMREANTSSPCWLLGLLRKGHIRKGQPTQGLSELPKAPAINPSPTQL